MMCENCNKIMMYFHLFTFSVQDIDEDDCEKYVICLNMCVCY